MAAGRRRAGVVLNRRGNQANRAIYPCVAPANELFEVLAACDLEEAKARDTAAGTGLRAQTDAALETLGTLTARDRPARSTKTRIVQATRA